VIIYETSLSSVDYHLIVEEEVSVVFSGTPQPAFRTRTKP
jgi:hypothetical protein